MKNSTIIVLSLFLFNCYSYKRPEVNCTDFNVNTMKPTGVVNGKLLLPDPKNFMTGVFITDCDCWAKIKPLENNRISVQSNFWKGKREARVMTGANFYLGKLENREVFILQKEVKHIILTHTAYDADDKLIYGKSGKGEMIKECLIESGVEK